MKSNVHQSKIYWITDFIKRTTVHKYTLQIVMLLTVQKMMPISMNSQYMDIVVVKN